MAFAQRFVVSFDDGTSIEVQSSSRDMVALEKAGIDLTTMTPILGSYTLAHATLQRLKRVGKIDIDVPDTADELADLADLEPISADEEDPEGNGSGQAPITG